MSSKIVPSGQERFFDSNEIIVSKTDLKGHITYTNEMFIQLAGFTEKELLGQPHSMIRHPDMPRCIFKLLWGNLQAKKEIFAYVVNMCKNGDHYWVLAHVTPTFDETGAVTSYHSSRRVPDRNVLNTVIIPLYKTLLAEEKKHTNRKEGMESAFKLLMSTLKAKGVSYDEFIFSR